MRSSFFFFFLHNINSLLHPFISRFPALNWCPKLQEEISTSCAYHRKWEWAREKHGCHFTSAGADHAAHMPMVDSPLVEALVHKTRMIILYNTRYITRGRTLFTRPPHKKQCPEHKVKCSKTKECIKYRNNMQIFSFFFSQAKWRNVVLLLQTPCTRRQAHLTVWRAHSMSTKEHIRKWKFFKCGWIQANYNYKSETCCLVYSIRPFWIMKCIKTIIKWLYATFTKQLYALVVAFS